MPLWLGVDGGVSKRLDVAVVDDLHVPPLEDRWTVPGTIVLMEVRERFVARLDVGRSRRCAGVFLRLSCVVYTEKEGGRGVSDNIETVKDLYAAFGRGDVTAILERVTDDVDWATDAAIESAPWYGPKQGKAGVTSFFEGIASTGPVTEFALISIAGNDDGDVHAFIRYAFTVTATGKSVAMNLHHYWRFRDGKVCFVRASEDTALVAAALAG
jgi:uncharacterized protein